MTMLFMITFFYVLVYTVTYEGQNLAQACQQQQALWQILPKLKEDLIL